MPTRGPWSSRTGPCSIWSSMKTSRSRRTAVAAVPGSRPTARMAAASVIPSESRTRSTSPGSTPTNTEAGRSRPARARHVARDRRGGAAICARRSRRGRGSPSRSFLGHFLSLDESPAHRIGYGLALVIDRATGDERADDLAAERSAHIRVDSARTRPLCVHRPLTFGVEQNDVRIRPLRDRAFARPEAESLRWPRRKTPDHEARDLLYVEYATSMPGNAGEDGGQERLRAGDATPCREDIGGGFEIRQAGRVIRRHEVDLSLEQRAPQAVAVTGVADRRRALERCALRREIVVIERQVVRTGLDGNVGAHVARRADRPERLDRRDMHDVDARTGFPRGRARGSHRPDLDERRPRLGPGSRVLPALAAHPRSRFADQRVVLAMERHD